MDDQGKRGLVDFLHTMQQALKYAQGEMAKYDQEYTAANTLDDKVFASKMSFYHKGHVDMATRLIAAYKERWSEELGAECCGEEG
jgi:hypothetical protein